MERGAAFPADATSSETTQELGSRHVEEDHAIELDTFPAEQRVERFCLRHRSGETIEHPPAGGIGLSQPLFRQADDDLVRYELPTVHVSLGLEAQTPSILGRLAKHVTGGDMWDSPFRGKTVGLCALASAWWPEEDDANRHACAFARLLRKPS